LGRSALIVDQRAAGRSGGNVITFGVKEHKDCLRWIDFMVEHFGEDVKIVLCGISMGAATVLLAAGEPLPKQVVGVLADCGYSSAKKIIYKVIRQMKLPPRLLYPFVRLGGLLFGGFDPNQADVTAAMKRCQVPVILFHGDGDDFVPCSMSQENFDACPAAKQLVLIPGAGHGLCYVVDPEGYLQALQNFNPNWGL
jgi:pimeloyl-ACP methyl ester carboxylesterase